MKLNRITINTEVMGGQPCIRGLRGEILEDYPELQEEDIKQALEFAA